MDEPRKTPREYVQLSMPEHKEQAIQLLRTFLEEHTHDAETSSVCRQRLAWHFFHLCHSTEQMCRDVVAFYHNLSDFPREIPLNENNTRPEEEELLRSYMQQCEAGTYDTVSCFYGDILTLLAEQRWKYEEAARQQASKPSPQGKNSETSRKKNSQRSPKNGFFKTPAAVAQFMVEMLQPGADETVYDPAAGTCGLLVEAYRQNNTLGKALQGDELDPEVAVLGAMNMILHGIDVAGLHCKNALSMELFSPKRPEEYTKLSLFPSGELQEHTPHIADVVLTHLPFHEHELASQMLNKRPKGFRSGYDRYYLQQCMKSLKEEINSRCALIIERKVLLSENEEYIQIRQTLFREFNIQMIITLPAKTFGDASNGAALLLFFSREHGTKRTLRYAWPEDGPATKEFFAPIRKIWGQRQKYLEENEPLPEDEAYKHLWIECYDDLHQYEESRSKDSDDGVSQNSYKLLHDRPQEPHPFIDPKQLVQELLEQAEEMRKAAQELQRMLEQGEKQA